MVQGAQGHVEDPRNERVLVYVNGDLVPRDKAMVSAFDAGFVLGDGIWEAMRVINGRLFDLDKHIDRLYRGARAIDMDIGRSRAELIGEIQRTLDANQMRHGAHIRVMITRGIKATPNQDPRYTIGKATVVMAAEFKQPNPEMRARGLKLFTSTVRCSPPDMFDMQLNTHSRLNLIIALNQALKAGADEALMLDPHGFVSSCNSTNFFIVRGGELLSSTGSYAFQGITRGNVLAVARETGVPTQERNFTLAEAYSADEAFVTGTFGGLTPVREIDGRTIGSGARPMTDRLRGLYEALQLRQCPP
jgi:branched-chain amino acid aminotransferase